jgi:TonB family protein
VLELRAKNMNNTEAWKTWEGRTVDGKFPLRQWLGGSDHSAVFLTDLGGSQKTVIKLIAASLHADRQLSRWAAAAKLSHPHLIRLFEMGRCRFDGIPLLYLVMEYAEENLSQILPLRALTPAEVGDMLPPALDALSYLHGKGLVHSSVRPSNILAVADRLKLSTDRVCQRGDSDDKPASLTIYNAPELANGDVSPSIDVWGLGVTLVVTLTQHPPTDRATEQKDPVVPDSIPEPFRSIARESLHRQLKQRCTIADIKAWRPPQQAAPVPAVADQAPKVSKSSGWRIAVPVAIVLAAVMVFAGRKIVARYDEAPSAQSTTNAEPTAPVAAPPGLAVKPAMNATAGSASEDGVVHQVIPDVPRSASNTITGRIKVGVRVEVDASGKVAKATLTTPGPSKYFANLALKAAQGWEFAAPQTNGKPTPSTWIVRFEFAKTSTKAFPRRERR